VRTAGPPHARATDLQITGKSSTASRFLGVGSRDAASLVAESRTPFVGRRRDPRLAGL